MAAPRKLTYSQLSMLADIRDHGDPWFRINGLAASGGATQTLASLIRRGLIESRDPSVLTTAGQEAIQDVHY